MKKLLQIKSFLCTLLLMQMFTVLQAQNSVGAIPGVVDVSPMGAATYTIPIEVVPGTQGMQPNLSIVYNSSGGMGLLGMKWNLAGLSAITRCGQVPYYDDNITAIQFVNANRFALDGNRLIKINTASWICGAEWATEVENFTRIISDAPNCRLGMPPALFTAYTDDGSIVEYGNTTDSKQILSTLASPPYILSWCVNKITDSNGNYMTFHYNNADKEILIDSIRYTGNGFQPYAKVEFGYTTLPDTLGQNTYFVGGYGISQSKLLNTITVCYKDTIVRKYQFNYNINDSGERTAHLKEVVLYGENGRERLESTTIEWGAQNTTIENKKIEGLPNGKILTGDFNGDGYTDLLIYQTISTRQGWKLYMYNPLTNNYYEDQAAGDITTMYDMLYVHDFDGNGKDELLMGTKTDNSHTFKILSLPNKTQIGSTFTFNNLIGINFGDFDGNGSTDIVFAHAENTNPVAYKVTIKKIEGNGIANMGNPMFFQSIKEVKVLDVNGNGKKNFQVIKNDATSMTDGTSLIYEYDGSAFQSVFQDKLNLPGGNYTAKFYGDINGDGITDVIAYCMRVGIPNDWRIYISKGINSYDVYYLDEQALNIEEGGNIYSGIKPVYGIMVADVNGDGKDDIIQLVGNKLNILFSKGWVNGKYIYKKKTITIPEGYVFENGTFGDFNGDGRLDLILKSSTSNFARTVYFSQDNDYEFVKKIKDGIGKTVQLSYKHQYYIAKSLHYTSVSNYVTSFRKHFLSTVDFLQVSNGIGNDLTTWQYQYNEPAFSLLRRHFFGFKEFICTNNLTNEKDSRYFEFSDINNYPLRKQILIPVKQVVSINNQTLNETLYSYKLHDINNTRFIPYYSVITAKDMLSDAKTVTTNTLGTNIRLLESNIKTYNGLELSNWLHSETKTYTYETITLNDKQKKTVQTKILTTQQYGSNGTVIADTLTYGYYPASEKGRLAWIRKGNIHGVMKTSYGNYSITGVYREKTVSTGNDSRKEIYDYDPTRRFVMQTKSFDFPDLITYFNYDAKTGNKTSETDVNGLKTTYKYDSFGNLTQINYPDSTKTNTSVKWHTGSNPPDVKYYTTATSSGKADVMVYYDVLGREMCRLEDGYYFQTVYNNKGQVLKTSGPFQTFNEPDIIWHNYTYDDFGRKETEKEAPYIDLSYTYTNREIKVTDNLRKVSSFKNYDALGRITQAKDEGGTISYSYDVTANKQHRIIISLNNLSGTTTILSDLWGNRLSITDPDAGKITFTYNNFNELLTQIDARNNTTKYQYDKLGRVTQKQFTATGAPPQTITYTYDNASGKGKGKLSQIKINDTVAETFTYDTYSRLSEHKKIIDGASYTHKYSYTANGQLYKLTYPDNFAVTYTYTRTGELSYMSNGNTVIYNVNSRNKYHAPTHCQYGNNLNTNYEYNATGQVTGIKTWVDVSGSIFDPGGGVADKGGETPYLKDSVYLNYRYAYNDRGVMSSRSESVMNRLEKYKYDNLDRLIRITAGAIGQIGTSRNFTYSANGNIEKSLIGNYTYDSNKPHAVIQIDADHPYTKETNVIYNFFNQPTEITEENCKLYLSYDANQQRQKTVKKNITIENTHFYINKYYEKEINSANVTTHYHYIYGDNGVVALHISYPRTDSMYYIHTDHLGSYCLITDANRKVVQRTFFDPWGNYYIKHGGEIVTPNDSLSGSHTGEDPFRDNTDTLNLNFTLINRGFTGHEHYPYFNIINMNARLYDPKIGRFFSPDKYVANSSFTQDFNRYSYARNNPLMYTDPNGELPWLVPVIIVAAIAATSYTVNVATSYGGFQNWNWGQFAFSTILGGVTGAFSSGVGTVVGDLMTSAGVGGFAGGAVSGAAAGLVSGTINGLVTYSMTNDKNAIWKSALMGAGMGGLLGGIQGGIESKLKGGRFWDGATVTKGTSYTQPISQVSSGQDQCTFDNLKAVDQSLGLNHSDAELRSCLAYSENGLPYDVDTWNNYSELTGRTVTNFRGNPEGAIDAFQGGARISISYDQVDQFGNPSQHCVVLRNYQSVTLTKVNGVSFYNPNLRIMDPGGSGWGWNKWRWGSFAGGTNNLFVIY